MNPGRFLRLGRYGTLLGMADGWSDMSNLTGRFLFYDRDTVRAVKVMAAALDASGDEHVGAGFFK